MTRRRSRVRALIVAVAVSASLAGTAFAQWGRRSGDVRRPLHVRPAALDHGHLRVAAERIRRQLLAARISARRAEPDGDGRQPHGHRRQRRRQPESGARRLAVVQVPRRLVMGAGLLGDDGQAGRSAARIPSEGRVHRLQRLRAGTVGQLRGPVTADHSPRALGAARSRTPDLQRLLPRPGSGISASGRASLVRTAGAVLRPLRRERSEPPPHGDRELQHESGRVLADGGSRASFRSIRGTRPSSSGSITSSTR